MKKNKNKILSNQQFVLGSIIKPIIEPIVEPIIKTIKTIEPIDSSVNMIIKNINLDTILNPVYDVNLEKNNTIENTIANQIMNSIENPFENSIENLIETPIENPIDIVFGVVNENQTSPSLDEKKHFNFDLKQIYPPLNNNTMENKSNQKYSNVEIKAKIDKLSENELCEIFKIIKNNKEKYSTNNNGIFINISKLKQISINEICMFLNYCDNNNRLFDLEEQTRDIYREMLL